jgi:hypothetical protein
MEVVLGRVARFPHRLQVAVALASGAVALIAAGAAPASVSGSPSWKVQQRPSPGTSSNDNGFSGVAVTSPTNAWAVGDYATGPRGSVDRVLIEHWNGKAWKVQRSPNAGGSISRSALSGVAATSSTDAWAVGYYYDGTVDRTLIEHWNGKAWQVQQSRNSRGSGDAGLSGVAATSPTNAWAVGSYHYGTVRHGGDRTLIEHWNGNAWKVQRSPNPSNVSRLSGVAATSPTNAWAVGYYHDGTVDLTLVEHWNGKAWKVQQSPNPGGSRNYNGLSGVAATSSTNAWAVGYFSDVGGESTLVERWNGKSWKVQQSAPDYNVSFLSGVAATSPTDAWAVGFDQTGQLPETQTLVEHWDGNAWTVQKSASPGRLANSPALWTLGADTNHLFGVAATSPTNAWAVGLYAVGWGRDGTVLYQPLIERRG